MSRIREAYLLSFKRMAFDLYIRINIMPIFVKMFLISVLVKGIHSAERLESTLLNFTLDFYKRRSIVT
jgi:hypothetical protein